MSDDFNEKKKPYEALLTVLVAAAAALAGTAGFLSAGKQNEENDARALALSKLSEANTKHLEASQNISRDEAILIQALILLDENRTQLALDLIAGTQLVRGGYLNADLSLPPKYPTLDAALDAYEHDMYLPSRQARAEADAAFVKAEAASKKGLDYLFATVLLAIGAMLGTVGMSASGRGPRLALSALVLVFIGIAGGFIGYTAAL